MNVEQLRKLLRQQEPEGIKLDFKQKLHAINHSDKKVRENHWNELIKDILALANGNVGTARQIGYLIIGVADKLNQHGTRDLYDVGELKLSEKEILTKVNNACTPPLPTISCEIIIFEGQRLLIIKIPPTPYLHETTKPLTMPNQVTYQEHVVFIRRKEDIGLASTLERQAILAEKQGIILPPPHKPAKPVSSPFAPSKNKTLGGLILLGLLICMGLVCFGVMMNSIFSSVTPQEKSTQATGSTPSAPMIIDLSKTAPPESTLVPTNTPKPTNTPEPTLTNTAVVPPTSTPTLVVLPTEISTSVSPTALPEIILPIQGSMRVDNWEIQVERIELAESLTFDTKIRKAAGRFALLFLAVTNRDLSPDTFVAFGTVDVITAEGIRYEEDAVLSFWAYVQYNTDIGAEINPDATEHVVAVFDISKQSATYTLIPGSLAKSSTGSVALQIP